MISSASFRMGSSVAYLSFPSCIFIFELIEDNSLLSMILSCSISFYSLRNNTTLSKSESWYTFLKDSMALRDISEAKFVI